MQSLCQILMKSDALSGKAQPHQKLYAGFVIHSSCWTKAEILHLCDKCTASFILGAWLLKYPLIFCSGLLVLAAKFATTA